MPPFDINQKWWLQPRCGSLMGGTQLIRGSYYSNNKLKEDDLITKNRHVCGINYQTKNAYNLSRWSTWNVPKELTHNWTTYHGHPTSIHFPFVCWQNNLTSTNFETFSHIGWAYLLACCADQAFDTSLSFCPLSIISSGSNNSSSRLANQQTNQATKQTMVKWERTTNFATNQPVNLTAMTGKGRKWWGRDGKVVRLEANDEICCIRWLKHIGLRFGFHVNA